jgi:hypothetical protein
MRNITSVFSAFISCLGLWGCNASPYPLAQGSWVSEIFLDEIQSNQSLEKAWSRLYERGVLNRWGGHAFEIQPNHMVSIQYGWERYPARLEQKGQQVFLYTDRTKLPLLQVSSGRLCADYNQNDCFVHQPASIEKKYSSGAQQPSDPVEDFAYQKLLQGTWVDSEKHQTIKFSEQHQLIGWQKNHPYDQVKMPTLNGDFFGDFFWLEQDMNPANLNQGSDMIGFERKGTTLTLFNMENKSLKGEKPFYTKGKVIFSGVLFA